MHRRSRFQIIRFLSVVLALFSAFLVSPGVAGAQLVPLPVVQGSPPPEPLSDEDWLLIIRQIFEGLQSILNSPPSAIVVGTSESLMGELSDDFWANGLPDSLDPAEARSMIANVYSTLRRAVPTVDALTASRFLNDLTWMYAELGGNPLELIMGQ